MSRYGLDLYDVNYYGPPASALYTSPNFVANSIVIGRIDLTWVSPYGDWSKIALVRNSLGFPVDAWDGTRLDIKGDGSFVAFKETDPTYYSDTTVSTTGGFYYYSLFIFKNSDKVWVRAGNAIGLAVGEYDYTNMLYEYMPNIYKLNSLSDPVSDNFNQDLYNFLSLFGFQLNKAHTYTNLLVNRYNIQTVGGTLIPALMQEVGLSHEPEIGYQQERVLVQNAYRIYKERGSIEGLREYIKAYSGYGITQASTAPNSPINGTYVGKNIMLDYNDSSFEESVGHWKSSDSSASLYCLKNYNITQVQLSSNVATLTVGAHNYQVGNQIYVSGCSFALFNSTASPVTITAVTSTTISYSLTGTDFSQVNAYNSTTNAYPIVYSYPKAWNETTAPALYPNKQKGIIAVKNANSSSGTVLISCGEDAPILKGVPVTAGSIYSFSIYAVSGGTARTITPSIKWYDRFGAYISSSTGTGTSDSTGQFSVRLKVENSTAPVGATYAVPALSIASSAGSASNEWHYFDCAQFELSSSATAFEEARQLHITLKANRINELANPHFVGTTSAAPWTPTGATQTVIVSEVEPNSTIYTVSYLTLASGIASLESTVTSDLVVGDSVYVKGVSGITDGAYTVTAWYPSASNYSSYIQFNTGGSATVARTAATGKFYKSTSSLQLTATSSTVTVKSWDGSTNSQMCNIYYPSTPYTFSIYAKSTNVTDTITPSITWYDSSHTLISTTTGSPTTISHTVGDLVWNRAGVTGTAPSNAAYATVTATVATSSGKTILLDEALFENQAFVLDFFNGSGGFANTSSFLWEGTANASRSHYYKNYAVVSNRLANGGLNKELLLGTTVALYYAQPNT